LDIFHAFFPNRIGLLLWVECHPGDGELVDVAAERAAVQQVSHDIIKPREESIGRLKHIMEGFTFTAKALSKRRHIAFHS